MKVTRLVPGLLALSLVSAWPALADGINAHVSSVDPAAHTITCIEGGKDLTFALTDATQLEDSTGAVLATGLTHEGKNVLESCVKAGILKTGTRLSIVYVKADGAFPASEIKLRDFTKPASK